jgi:uncharacterized protein (TIGR02391 family)
MATRKATPSQPQAANLTPERMRAAIPKLQRRVDELKAFDVATIDQPWDPKVETLATKIEDTLAEVFGHGTLEYYRFHIDSLDGRTGFGFGGPNSAHEYRQRVVEEAPKAVAKLQTAIDRLNEQLADGGQTPSGRAARAIDSLELHPEIERAALQLFRDGHYANAVEDGCKALDGLVKLRSGKFDLSNVPLMQTVFSPNAPILKFNDQKNDSEKSEQQGMMFMFAGAMSALRNPRAHGLVKDHPERAVEYLTFLSMLATALDRATRA